MKRRNKKMNLNQRVSDIFFSLYFYIIYVYIYTYYVFIEIYIYNEDQLLLALTIY